MDFFEWAFVIFNVFTFVLMAYDKRISPGNKRRIPERLMIILAVLGGSAGVWFGMKVFRHKTKHPRFAYGIPLIIALQVLLLLYVSLR
ncbi:MAG: DUF1294 domain-containing protein [Bacillota bacterium]|nr:DUF1294 domain-containing protein [Bacillota bacterium]MDW7683525.1 DUF1294 domain-containing protein [Bacillota bacterium]